MLSRVTLKFDGWSWETIGHLFYAISSFVHHFIAICVFRMELQSGNAKFWSKSVNFFVHCDLEIRRMTLKNNRAPLLRYFKLCASFHSHPWIQTGVTVWKRISYFFTSVALTSGLWPWPFANLWRHQWHHHHEKYFFGHDLEGSFNIYGQMAAVFNIAKFSKWPPISGRNKHFTRCYTGIWIPGIPAR